VKNNLYVFDTETGLWNTDNTSHLKIIQKFTDKLHLFESGNPKTGAVLSTRSYGNTLNLMEKIPTLIKILCQNNNWIRQKQYSSLGKIHFVNGHYDFKKQQFFSKAEFGFNPDIVFMGKIHHHFEPFYTEYIDSIKQRIFYDALGKEVGDYLILNLARGLAGDMMKRILFGLGVTNSGKSILTTAVTLSCGDYVGSFNAKNLAYRYTSNDEAQIMRWAMLLRFKRIVFSNEMKSTVELNGLMIKKISSGGDTLIGRNHCKAEEEFVAHFLPFCLANDLPNIKPYDDAVDTRVKVVSYTKSYVPEPANEMELQADPEIATEIKTKKFQKAFIGMLIHQYTFQNRSTAKKIILTLMLLWNISRVG